MTEPTLSVDYMDLVRVVARQMGYGSTYSSGTVTKTGTTITLSTGSTFPSWAGNAAINIGGTIFGITSRTDDNNLVADAVGDVSAATEYVLVQSITDDKADTFRDIQDVIDQAYQELCFPAPSDESYFIWSWLLERASISFEDNVANYDLPPNFGQFIDTAITYKAGLDLPSVTLLSQKEYRGEQSRDDSAGVPKYLMWRQKSFTATTGRRFEAALYPTPVSDQFPDPEYSTGTLTSASETAKAALTSDVSGTATTFAVNPAADYAVDDLLLIGTEIVKVTTGGTDVTSIDVVRGQLGTTATGHSTADSLYEQGQGKRILLTGGSVPLTPATLIIPGGAGVADKIAAITSRISGSIFIIDDNRTLSETASWTIRHNITTFSRDASGTFDGAHLEYLFRVVPDALNPTNKYPLCGSIHGDTLMKACQAVAERKLGDDAGIYEAKFKERLAASIAVDRAVKATMGI